MTVLPASVRIDYARDQSIGPFAAQTLKDRYLIPGEQSPQEAFARASAAFASNDAHAQRIYDYVSKGWFMFATPLLSNGGSDRGLPISCFLVPVEDSRKGIFDHWTEVGWLSSVGGGVGAGWSGLRSKGEKTSKGSQSTGAIPFIAVMDRLILSVSQGGTRRGSYAAYMDVHHPEIREFITIRKPTGGDRNRKAENIHNGVNITDHFMECVRAGKKYGLKSPKTGKVVKFEDARSIWRLMLETRMQTGEPYMHFVDTSNRFFPKEQKALGLKVEQSNLCVAPNTEVLTRDGYMPIASLEDKMVEVWNGEEWSTVLVVKTADSADLCRVWFEDGGYIDCTPYHKFYDQDGEEIRAGALNNSTILEEVNHPKVEAADAQSIDPDWAYTAGWATLSGFEDDNRLTVYAPHDLASAAASALIKPSVDMKTDESGLMIRYEPKSVLSGFTPFRWTLDAKRHWLCGVLESVGEWIEHDGSSYLSFACEDPDLVTEMRLLALECGLSPRIRLTDTGSGFMMCSTQMAMLAQDGFARRYTMRECVGKPGAFPDSLGQPIVSDVHPLPYKSATYCFTETQRSRGVFNGILTGNCTEIMLGTGRDIFDKLRTAVCCLSSVNGETFDEWKDDPLFILDMMEMLDNTLQSFIDGAPIELANAVYSASRERSVGLGLLGFHSYLQKHGIPFESEAARLINKRLFAHLKARTDEASLVLGAQRGEAPDMVGTGDRFTHKRAVAPNASSSILLGASAGIEPIPANVYLHKTLSGSFTVKNPYLERDLERIGLNLPEVWSSIIQHVGSVQHLTPEYVYENFGVVAHMQSILDTYRCASEMKQTWIVVHSNDRAGDIDQGQSVNLFMPSGTNASDLMHAHWMAWEGGTKSLYYLRSSTEKRAENTNTKVERKKIAANDESGFDDLTALMAGNAMTPKQPDCEGCDG